MMEFHIIVSLRPGPRTDVVELKHPIGLYRQLCVFITSVPYALMSLTVVAR
jgi:hypothetical protein